MKRRSRLTAVIAAHLVAAAGCGYPTFQFTSGGAGGASSVSSTASSSSSSAASAVSSSSATSSSGGGGATTASTAASSSSSSSSSGAPCTLGHVVISQIRSRGVGGATDEFIELFNPTNAPVLLDSGWTLDARAASLTSVVYSNRWTGAGSVLPPHSHFLVVGSGYIQKPDPDDFLAESIGDEDSVVLNLNGAAVDAVCYYHDATGLVVLTSTVYDFTCEGMPVSNPHDDTDGTDVDMSLDRRPGGAAGNCTDTQDNSSDFVILSPAAPEDLTSPPTPG